MAKNSEYWEKRIAAENWKVYNSLEEKNRALLQFYIDASEKVKDELYWIAEKYSKDGVLSLSDMHKQNRLTKLNQKFESIIENLGHAVESTTKENMQQGFQDVYKNVAVAMEDMDFAMPNKKMMEKLLNTPWRGDTFSKRLWKNQKKLVENLNDALLVGLQQGKTVTEIAITLHYRMGQGFNDCHRLVRTETMHYLNDATLRRYKDAGVEYVLIWAALDERTCDTCGNYHEKIYPIDKCPAVPLHANCRCTVLPVMDEMEIAKQERKWSSAAKEAERNTNTPVKFDERYDYSIQLEGIPDSVNAAMSECARSVAEMGTNDGNEHMYLVDITNGECPYYEKGISGEVGGIEFWKYIEEYEDKHFAFIHNHNTDGYFSETDMRTLLRTKQIDAMIAVRNDAVIYLAEKGKETPETGFFDDLFKEELEQLNEKVRSGEISLSDRNIKREEIIVNGLIKKYTKAGKLVEIDGRM